MRFLGFEVDRSLPFATQWQQWVWEDDDLDTIDAAFRAMVSRIENDGACDCRETDPLRPL
jgi:hypothetical protein